MIEANVPFWSREAETVMDALGVTGAGLSSEDARRRLEEFGPNRLQERRKTEGIRLLLSQFASPVILILLAAATLSIFLHDRADATIILLIVFISGLLGYWQERGAANAVEKLLELVELRARVRRDGTESETPMDEVVPGDIILLSAGSGIPGDCLLLESNDLSLDQAALTGETFPVDKFPGAVPADTELAARSCALYMGTHVVSGSGRAVVIDTGRRTEFGKVAQRLRLRPAETDFEHGIRRFGYFLMQVTLLMLVGIFAINTYLQEPVLDSFLFALALAVGLTPQLLPAIVSVSLAQGAKRMAKNKAIVKRLASIENLGSIDIFCSDKTGTLTEGLVRIKAQDLAGNDSDRVLEIAYLNSFFETGFPNPIDAAIRAVRQFDVSNWQKLDENPYDFVRKRLGMLVSRDRRSLLITKGALNHVLDVCSTAELPDGRKVGIDEVREWLDERYQSFSSQACRMLGVAVREMGAATKCLREDKVEMCLIGYLVFNDPPKDGVAATITELCNLGVSLKMITGDNHLVARSVGGSVGLQNTVILTGPEMRKMSESALIQRAPEVDIFAEVEPNQKEHIILALQKSGHVVGYLGDGINDAPALHAADVGISVDSAVDVAKDAADIVLLEHELEVVVRAVRDGRATFTNTLKYIFIATSANFGNMFSMAGASTFLPFLPLLPQQILLTNLLTDFPAMTIASDRVDAGIVERPRKWDLGFIRRFMITFGLLSSVFDYLTFGVLLLLLKAGPVEFRTGWFLESVVSACLVLLVVRTQLPFYRSRPGQPLFWTTCLVAVIALILPFTPLGPVLGFTRIPVVFLPWLAGIVVAYIGCAELTKRWFFHREARRTRLA
ncbi:MAG: magnesium-translocating P-type ATPase [Bryobacterales bacterium]|nr:magnesium-translocating P-type ATPase [Bryobacterales bacterium]